eukprot:TRINITY_DN7431_c0_g1_i1.p1 TRINITY_DN7431_c0_g1~~TRINITY_DN7431_c0_g1_i1.p1  ORF type:complete len:377 (+),score=102.19 TRINITY_DN7431_c0_g1_i1:34-1164(+)
MGEKFCRKWNDYDRNLSSTFCNIREESEFLDVTLACEDEAQVSAHKVVLSACSPFFRSILRRNPHAHPLLYLRGVRLKELEAIIHFMYNGEVNVLQENLNEFLLVAEDLKIKGLTQTQAASSNNITTDNTTPTSPHTQLSHNNKTTAKQPQIASISTLSAARSISSGKRSNSGAELAPSGNGSKRAKLDSLLELASSNNSKLLSKMVAATSSSGSSSADIILPSSSSLTSDQEISDLTIEQEQDTFDESSIIEETYDAEEGDYAEDYDPIEISPAVSQQLNSAVKAQSMSAAASESTSGNGGNSSTRSSYVTCPVCDKLMYRKNLARHVAVKHTGTAPAQCTLCGKTMKNGWSLKEHERKYHHLFQTDKVLLAMEN